MFVHVLNFFHANVTIKHKYLQTIIYISILYIINMYCLVC